MPVVLPLAVGPGPVVGPGALGASKEKPRCLTPRWTGEVEGDTVDG